MQELNQKYAEFSQTAFIWENQMADVAADIILKRRAFIEKISDIADDYHRRIAGENEDIKLIYEPCVEGEDREAIRAAIAQKLEEAHEKDYELGYTSVGVHREDFNIACKGVDLRKFGSQGQEDCVRTDIVVLPVSSVHQDVYVELLPEV